MRQTRATAGIANATYIFWYDQVIANTNGIGTIHSRLYTDSGAGSVVGPGGYFIRHTASDTLAAVMSNTTVDADTMMTHVGDLFRVDLTGGSQPARVVDQITYMDMMTSGARVVYSRRDGVFITNFQ